MLTQLPMVSVLPQLEVQEEQKKITTTLPGLGDVLRETPYLRASPNEPSYVLTGSARPVTCRPRGWHAILRASVGIPATSDPHSDFLYQPRLCRFFGAFGTSPLSVFPSDNSWAHLLRLRSRSFSWTSPPCSTPPFTRQMTLGGYSQGESLAP